MELLALIPAGCLAGLICRALFGNRFFDSDRDIKELEQAKQQDIINKQKRKCEHKEYIQNLKGSEKFMHYLGQLIKYLFIAWLLFGLLGICTIFIQLIKGG